MANVKTGKCADCGFNTKLTRTSGSLIDPAKWLCSICFETAGLITATTICYVGNMILRELKKVRKNRCPCVLKPENQKDDKL